jgi:hypothetical protein
MDLLEQNGKNQMWGVVKFNVDAALFHQQNSLLDERGEFIRANTLHKQQLFLQKRRKVWGLKKL